MTTIRQRLCSWVLTLAMLVSLLPAYALPAAAADTYNVFIRGGLASDLTKVPAGSGVTIQQYLGLIATELGATINVTSSLPDNSSRPAVTNDYDLIIFVTPTAATSTLTAAEEAALKAHLAKGGRIVFIGEHPADADFVASNALISGIVAKLGGIFSITTNYIQNQVAASTKVAGTLVENPLTTDVDTLLPQAASGISYQQPAVVLATAHSATTGFDEPWIVDQAVGNGAITLISDSDAIGNGIKTTVDANAQNFIRNWLTTSRASIDNLAAGGASNLAFRKPVTLFGSNLSWYWDEAGTQAVSAAAVALPNTTTTLYAKATGSYRFPAGSASSVSGTGLSLVSSLLSADRKTLTCTFSAAVTYQSGGTVTAPNAVLDSSDFYVHATSGNDDNDGSAAAPFQSLLKALQSIPASGGTVYLQSNVVWNQYYAGDGSYANTGSKKITIRSADPANRCTISCQPAGTASSSLFHLVQNTGANLTLANVIVDGTGHTAAAWGDFFIGNGSTLTLASGATLQNFTPRAVNVRSGGKLVMQAGSEIKDCTAGLNPSYSEDGYTGYANAGAAVYLCPGGTLEMTGGTITGCKSSTNLGAVFADINTSTSNPAIIKMSGLVKIENNTCNNLYLGNKQTITLTGALTAGSSIGVYTHPNVPTAGNDILIATASGYTIKDSDRAAFHSDNAAGAGVLLKDGKLYLSAALAASDVLIWSPRILTSYNDFVTKLEAAFQAAGKTVKVDVGTPVSADVANTSTAVDTAANHLTGVEDLAGQYGLVIIPGTASALNATDLAALAAFLKAGGRIVMAGELPGGAYDVLNTNLSAAGAALGAHFTITNISGAYGAVSSAAASDSTLLNDINPSAIKPNACSLISYVLPAKAVLKTVEDNPVPWVVDQAADQGRITVLSDTDWLKGASGENLTAARAFILNWLTDSEANKLTVQNGGYPNNGWGSPGTAAASVDRDGKVVVTLTVNEAGVYTFMVDGVAKAGLGIYDAAGMLLATTDANGTTGSCQLQTGTSYTVRGVPVGCVLTAQLGATGDAIPVTVPAVGQGQLSAAVVRGSASLTIDPADKAMQYGVVAADGSILTAPHNGWYTPAADGTLTITGLAPGQSYKVVARPAAASTSLTAAATTGVAVTMPASGFTDVDPVAVTRDYADGGHNIDKITLASTVAKQEYYLVDETGAQVGNAQTSVNGEHLVFDGLDKSKTYTVLTCTPEGAGGNPPASVPGAGVEVSSDVVRTGNVTQSLQSDGKTSFAIAETKAAVKYALVDAATGLVVAPAKVTGKAVDDLDGWVSGNGGTLTFNGLLAGGQYRVITAPATSDSDASDGSTGGDEKAASPYPQDAAALAALVGPTAAIPAVVRAQLTAEVTDAARQKGSLTIEPADGELEYALIDQSNAVKANWQAPQNGAVIFQNVDTNIAHIIVTRPRTDTTSAPPAKKATGVAIKLPDANFVNVTAADLTREAVSGAEDKLTIADTSSNQQYYLTDAAGNIVKGPEPGSGGTLTFTGLSPDADYFVRSRSMEGGGFLSVPGPAVPVPAATVKPSEITLATDGVKRSLTVANTDEHTKYALVDESGAVVAPAKVTGRAVADLDGWVSGNNGSLTFNGLLAGGQYRVITAPATSDSDATDAATGGDAAAASPYPQDAADLAALVGPTAAIPAVEASQLTAEIAGTDPKTVTVNIADPDPDLQYAFVDANGNLLAAPYDVWYDASSGDLLCGGLAPATGYKIVVRPANGTATAPTPAERAATGVAIRTPSASYQPVTVGALTREDGPTPETDQITVSDPVAGQEYYIVDKNGAQVGEAKTAKPGDKSLTFTGLTPGEDYTVLTREPNALPAPSVPVPGSTVKPSDVQATTAADGASGALAVDTVAGVRYALVDADTGAVITPVTAVNGSGEALTENNGWVTADGSALTFTDLLPGTRVRIVSVPADGGELPDSGDALIGPSLRVPTVSPSQLTAETVYEQEQGYQTSVTIAPTSAALQYALFDTVTKTIVKLDPADPDGWYDGGETLHYTGLTGGRRYEVVALPIGAQAPDDGTDLSGEGTVIIPPPNEPFTTYGREHAEDGTDTGKFNTSVAGTDYALRDQTTGKLVPLNREGTQFWQTGGSGFEVKGLDPKKTYEIVTRATSTDGIAIANTHVLVSAPIGEVNASAVVYVADAGAPDGKRPVEGAAVTVAVKTLDGLYTVLRAVTDAEGRFTLRGVNVDDAAVQMYLYVDGGAEGTAVQSIAGFRLIQNQLEDVALTAGSDPTNLSGGVVSAHGVPATTGRLTLRSKPDGAAVTSAHFSDGSSLSQQGNLSNSGGYVLQNLQPGVYIVEYSEGGLSGMTELTVGEDGVIRPNSGGGYRSANLSLAQGSLVCGTVSGLADGQTATLSLRVPLYDAAGAIIGSRKISAVAEGTGGYWQLAGVPAGAYPVCIDTPEGSVTGTVTVNGNGYVTAVSDVLPAGAMEQSGNGLTVTVPAPAAAQSAPLEGAALKHDGTPATGASVKLYDENGDVAATVTVGAGGGYQFPAVADGTYYLSTDLNGANGLAGPIVAENGELSGKTTLTLSESAASELVGTVTDAQGSPAAGATVVIKDSAGKVLATTTTNAQGKYFVGSVPAGASAAITTRDGESKTVDVASISGPTQTEQPDAGSKPVLGTSGEKLALVMGEPADGKTGVTVASAGAGGADVSTSFTVDSQGNLAVNPSNQPDPGSYLVTLRTESGMAVTQSITVGSDGALSGSAPLRVAPRTVAGTVRYASGAVPTDATLAVTGWGSAHINPHTGQYSLAGLPDGVYQAALSLVDGGDANHTSVLPLTLTVTGGAVSYTARGAAADGTSFTAAGANLTVGPRSAVSSLIGTIGAAQIKLDSALAASENTALRTSALTAAYGAQDVFAAASDEMRKQVPAADVAALNSALAAVIGPTLAVSSNATGVQNVSAVLGELRRQQSLLVDEDDVATIDGGGTTADVSLLLRADEVTDEPTASVSKDRPAIEAEAGRLEAAGIAFYEVVVEKTTEVRDLVTRDSLSVYTTTIPVLPAPVEIALPIPEHLEGFAYYGAVTVHNGKLHYVPSRVADGVVTMLAGSFSTYAVLGSNDPIYLDDFAAETTGGSSPTVRIDSAEHGRVVVSPARPVSGQTVTLTTLPDTGYVLGGLTVTDRNGQAIALTSLGGGVFTFTQVVGAAQPAYVTARFIPEGETPAYNVCPRDAGCPIALFADLNPAAWYHDGVHYCIQHGLMRGMGGTSFGPHLSTTRGMIVTILHRLEGEPVSPQQTASFSDVTASQYYAQAVAWAESCDIARGYGDGTFGPNDPVTREQMAALLCRFAAYKGYDVTSRATLEGFGDAKRASGYAVGSLEWAVATGLLQGVEDDVLDPRGNATRVQTATLLLRYLQRFGG